MTSVDLQALLPLIVLSGAVVVTLLLAAFRRNHVLVFSATAAGLLAAFVSLVWVWPLAPRAVTPLLIIDLYGVFYVGLILLATLAVGFLAFPYLEKRPGRNEEFYVLLLLAALGAAVLVVSNHFASFFLALELLSASLYVLIAYQRDSSVGVEAALKYLVLAGISSGLILFGMALVYAAAGTLEFSPMAARSDAGLLTLTGLGLLVAGIGFKLAVVPFHLWTPDVYEGAPAPVTAFVATVSKGAMFALLLRYFHQTDFQLSAPLVWVFTGVAVASMVAGNLLALLQENVKRILAYSSIAHLGYLLVAFLASGRLATAAVTFYLIAYFITTLGAFGVVSLLSNRERDADALDDYRGLAWRRPWLAAAFTAMLLSLAGIPLTAGFLGKFYVLAAGVESARWLLVIVLVVTSAIGLYYYLRILVTLYRREEGETAVARAAQPIHVTGAGVMAVLTAALVWLGVYPAPVIDLIQRVAERWVQG